MNRTKWSVRSTPGADRDYDAILLWTLQKFGMRQSKSYDTTLRQALRALVSGPDTIGAKRRDDIAPGIYTLHVARNGRKGRHFILFRVSGECTIDVLRILYDSMDLPSHV